MNQSENNDVAAAPATVTPHPTPAGLNELTSRIAPLFSRREPRLTANAYITALLSDLERKNGWSVAEFAGNSTPDAVQCLLNRAVWDEHTAADHLRDYVTHHLGHPEGALIADETGFLKKGRASAGVQRQYSGTAGRVENCQIGVFVAYASPRGHALIDAELYMPDKTWMADQARCAAAGVPAQRDFATKGELARQMIERAFEAGVAFAWVLGDTVYGESAHLRVWLEEHGLRYALAVPRTWRVRPAQGTGPRTADEAAQGLEKATWRRLSCGAGSKGERFYDWATVELEGGAHQLVARRRISDGEVAFFLVFAPDQVSMVRVVRAIGMRWPIEECFQRAKNEAGLDHYQVRRYRAWYRHVVLSMLAAAFLAVAAAAARRTSSGGGVCIMAGVAEAGMIALTCAEIRRMAARSWNRSRHLDAHHDRWSRWRRRHQYIARRCHYKRRNEVPL